MSLTDTDRTRIAQARALAAAMSHDEIRDHLIARGLMGRGEFKDREILPFALGVARTLLGDLADLAERLDSGHG